MYRVLLVDDELVDLEGMQRLIPWHEFDMRVVAALDNAYDALDYVREHEIDLLVTDIKMPILSGLELARQAVERRPGLKVLIVSGYADFQYARQAMRLDAAAYVLKPFSNEEFADALRAVRAELDEAREQERIREAYERHAALLRNEAVIAWLGGRGDWPSLLAAFRPDIPAPFHRDPPYVLGLFEPDDLPLKTREWPEEQRFERVQRWMLRFVSFLREAGAPVAGGWPDGRTAAVLPADEARDIVRRVMERNREEAEWTVTAALSRPFSSPHDAPAALKEARETMAGKVLLGKDRLIEPGDAQRVFRDDEPDIDVRIKRLYDAVAVCDREALDETLDDLFAVASRLHDTFGIHAFAVYLLSKIDARLALAGENVESLLGPDPGRLNELFARETLPDIADWTRDLMRGLAERWREKRNQSGRRLAETVESFVMERIGGPLSIREAAAHFAYTPNYLGRLFKEETGENFSDFVMRKRMEVAARLLCDRRLKVYEVAERVGFRNLAYFSKQFREHYGLTPNEYRRSRA